MADREKVIVALGFCTSPKEGVYCKDKICPYWGTGDYCMNVLMKDALSLLEMQNPTEPKMVNGLYECGECLYELRPDADSYCPCCGKKVKWSD